MADVEREKASPKGTFMYWSDWLGRDPKGLTYGAKGLWIDMLAVMGNKTPQGVISGDLESLAESLGYVGPMARAWVSEYKHLVEELESKGVFSRGRDIEEGLDSDAIVCRRLYRDRDRSQEISEARSRAARIRWDGSRSVPEGVVSLDQVRTEMAAAECKTDAKPCKGHANEMQNQIAEVTENEGDTPISSMQTDAKICYSPAQAPAPAQPIPTKPMGVQGVAVPVAVGNCLAQLQSLTGKEVYERFWRATGDRKERAKWWNAVVVAFKAAGQLTVLDDHLRYFESHREGIKKPSAYLVSRVLKSSRDLGITVPELPEGRS